MRSRTLVAIFASSRKCISLYGLPCICLNSRTLFRVCTPVVWKILVWKHVSHVSSPTGMVNTTVWTFLRAGKLYITDRRGPSTNVSYFHYRSGLVSCCFADSTCHQPVMAASSLQELASMRNLTTCELDQRRHLVTDVRTSNRHMD